MGLTQYTDVIPLFRSFLLPVSWLIEIDADYFEEVDCHYCINLELHSHPKTMQDLVMRMYKVISTYLVKLVMWLW